MSHNDDVTSTVESNVSHTIGQSEHASLSRAGFLKLAAGALGGTTMLAGMVPTTLAASAHQDTSKVHQIQAAPVGIFYITSLLDDYVLDVSGGSHAPATPLIAYPRNTPFSYNQLWYLAGDGYIVSLLTGFVLDINGGSTAPGARIIAYPKNIPPSDNQKWYVSSQGYIVSRLNGYVLDISGSSTEAGAPIISYPRNFPPSNNQRWRFVPAF
ncbi:RICIN domain-containing protein [Dictyobacter arantiisoli]|uniref:Ricin B lectin domain-containing protein n=1 Tax=Dictyobacter arantiisoli TaxID=2014874 RepID=A0A5A5THZ3_9CHLR|nr:RICIN domain-containing protein [Dictyobacter arantiisoli]GCF10828.1 hypothetical protein KDI_43920 [Dictyobacter arantiisoli]